MIVLVYNHRWLSVSILLELVSLHQTMITVGILVVNTVHLSKQQMFSAVWVMRVEELACMAVHINS